jgi:hypothetical protein
MNLLLLLPIGIFIISLFSFYKGNKEWKSGTTITTMDRNGGPITRTDSSKRMNWFSIGANIFGLIFLAIAIVTFILIHSDK